jgi:hypothetical protein
MFGLFKCTHPASRLGVERKETVEPLDDDFAITTYHLVCRKCGERVGLEYASLIDEDTYKFLTGSAPQKGGAA